MGVRKDSYDPARVPVQEFLSERVVEHTPKNLHPGGYVELGLVRAEQDCLDAHPQIHPLHTPELQILHAWKPRLHHAGNVIGDHKDSKLARARLSVAHGGRWDVWNCWEARQYCRILQGRSRFILMRGLVYFHGKKMSGRELMEVEEIWNVSQTFPRP